MYQLSRKERILERRKVQCTSDLQYRTLCKYLTYAGEFTIYAPSRGNLRSRETGEVNPLKAVFVRVVAHVKHMRTDKNTAYCKLNEVHRNSHMDVNIFTGNPAHVVLNAESDANRIMLLFS